ncbi:DUF4212 domain-containing protein [Flammeovirga aprica]|uniref:DUF4212 domain-containing protein n=1 Tax=Flammeovirga aprica JL-4 TaxID=694437 RepID=A0A7X9XBN2_9BACT|nr:DUF4212 domain-containing protein [Flammeovirga aprica]NME70784.1 DUF4212 domain-containing protein [Flammeovirga aprica JL-4]
MNEQIEKTESTQASTTSSSDEKKHYWKTNLKYLGVLLSIWFVTSFGAGILFKDALNEITLGGFKLGFWFAQQGSIYIFCLLIITYIFLMNKLDKRHHLEDE